MSLDGQMQKFINGDSSAFEKIYGETRKSVYYAALAIVRDKALAEDVMQSTYLSVFKNAKSYKAGTNAAAWIVRIARNEALNLKKRRSREESVDEQENLSAFGTSQPDEYGILTDLARRILTEDEFTVLTLSVICGYKRREIGAMLAMPTPTVTWKYKNAILKMRNALKEDE